MSTSSRVQETYGKTYENGENQTQMLQIHRKTQQKDNDAPRRQAKSLEKHMKITNFFFRFERKVFQIIFFDRQHGKSKNWNSLTFRPGHDENAYFLRLFHKNQRNHYIFRRILSRKYSMWDKDGHARGK